MLPGDPSAPVSDGLRILVVEDDRDTADSARMLLTLNGHLVEVVHDGDAAVENIRRGWPEVVLLDIALPGMNGYAIARAVSAMQLNCPPFLIAVTGYAMEQDLRRCEEAGIGMHLAKPVEPERLLGLMRKIQARKSSRKQPA
jgi:CheY-like chemotaxis protein